MSIVTNPGLKLDFQESLGRRAQLLEELRYEAGAEGSGFWIEVEQGFETDGLSVPRIPWAILPP